MKNKKSFPNLFRLDKSRLIVILLLLSSSIAIAQETPQSEFPIGSMISNDNIANPTVHQTYDSTGMNLLSEEASDITRPYLANYNVHALNMDSSADYIYHYSTAYYSKWQAVRDTVAPYIGFKHKDSLGNLIGSPATYLGIPCWSSEGLSEPHDSLLYGPHYHQEKWYRRWLYNDTLNMKGIYDVRYIPRYRMALKITDPTIDPNEDVCRIYVMVRHAPEINGHWNGLVYDDTLKSPRTLKVSDFQTYGQFKYIYFSDTPSERWYRYPKSFQSPGEYYKLRSPGIPDADTVWVDINGNNGVEFRVEWLRSDAKCTLYVDFVEVYDDFGWRDYIEDPFITSTKIKSYADSFKTTGWSNIKYWVGSDEPYSIDAYTPLRIVDSLLRNNNAPPLLVHLYPFWNIKINEDSMLARYYRTAKPDPLNIHFFPFNSWNVPASFGDWEYFRKQLQISYSLTKEKGFWYKLDNFGNLLDGGGWLTWRKPEPPEQKAEVMLALAHGVKGLTISTYDSYRGYDDVTQQWYTQIGLIGLPPNYTKDTLWYVFKDEIIQRLKGTLGTTLLDLDYTGGFIPIVQPPPPPPDDDIPSFLDYLALSSNDPFYHFHAGLLKRKNTVDDKYFLLVNLNTEWNRFVTFTVTNNFGVSNLHIKYVEDPSILDVTIQDEYSYELPMPPGEGYLFEVAPVVKYGGKLIYPETISSTTTLHDEMVIQNNAILTVNSTYNVYADIIVKEGGRIITTGNGLIKFYQGHKLIIEGNAILNGTVSNKLKLDFTNPVNSNGIIIKPGGSLTISYCEIKNAVKGITSELNLYSLNIQNVDFIDCDSVAVYIVGRNRLLEEITLTPPPPQIKYCNITNSDFGILVSNLSQIVIQQNTFTGTDLGIYLSNVTTPSIINNTLTGTSEMPGIFLESCNGVVRGNLISGHTNGITFGNSSPDCGGNNIEHNWNRGLYVGSGSLPNLRGKLVQDPIHPNLFYAVSGYNKIKENGGWEIEDDGSEIFINDANAILGDAKTYGCNEITDQRMPNTEDAPPLYNTQLLMNCIWSGHPQVVHAEGNFWDEHPIYRLEERFGDCNNIYLDPILNEPCPLPDGSDGKLFITSSTGEIIDTLYAEERTIETLTETEELYATAEEKFLTADFEDAEIIYNQIIGGNDSLAVKLDAYRRLFEIGKFLGRDEEYFTGLRNTYLSLAGSADDTLLIKILNQLSSLSLVANQEYVPAINEFDEIIQQNPNTEEAVFAEIDALTTALMVGDGDSTLQKGSLGKYLIKSSADYNSKLDGILRKHFGNGEKETEKEILPTEYTLYQNYPNPFNPTTTIKYDLPNTSDVSLIIYDILGRKVKELVNTKQQAGRYEIQFNASTLASGVYIYQLVTEKFLSSKKMILLK